MKGHFIFVVLICGAGGSTFKDLFSQGRAGKTQQRKAPATNLLMIMFDDLRPELSIYGRDYMITPNFERLANRSIIFDNAFCQVAVCNPSRDSLLTGLRPDNVGTYGFGHSFRPHQTINSLLVGAGYNTAGVGKIVHWDEPDHAQWSFSQWHDDWYGYQNAEWNWMNSSTMPDKVRPEEEFRDYKYASRAISDLRALSSSQKRTGKNFMLGLGFKLPHLCMHIPFKYFDLYRNRTDRFS